MCVCLFVLGPMLLFLFERETNEEPPANVAGGPILRQALGGSLTVGPFCKLPKS